MTKKCVKGEDEFKAKIKEIEKIIIGTIEYDWSKLINYLDFKEKIIK